MLKKIMVVLVLAFLVVPVWSTSNALAADCGQQMEAIGAVGAGYLYMTHGAIGAAGDALVKEVYKPEQVQGMMKETLAGLDVIAEQLRKVQAAGIDQADSAALGDMLAIIALLKEQATALSTYSATKDQAEAQRFSKARQECWSKIKVMLGI